jgi:enamine deaminase RidA (YjgF/YER057c/UK114 family)
MKSSGGVATIHRGKDMSVTRQTVSSGYPFEETYGYARAVRVGDQVFVSGTTARPPQLDGDAYTQLTGAIETIATALKAVGAELRHVVRTVIYVVDIADAHHVARAHLENFGSAPPASTLVQVARLTPAAARIEIEVTAIIHD